VFFKKEMSGSAAEQLNNLIANLESELGIDSNAPVEKKENVSATGDKKSQDSNPKEDKKAKKEKQPKPAKNAATNEDQPEITKLDMRVGKIVKVWKHETADK
jgi:aminoacyl tRNA synthase complex-interacting multifunctional protein 1